MNVDDLTVSFADNGVPKVRELAKSILSTSTSWATIAFLFQEADGDGGWRAPKVSLRRYRKRGKTFVVDRHLTLSTKQQAVDFSRAVDAWFAAGGPGDVAGAAPASDGDD